jgi:hypothetical protein
MALLGLIACNSPAIAASEFDPNRAKDFLENCAPENLRTMSGEMFGICVGFVDGLIARERLASEEKFYCPSKIGSREEAIRVLIEYIRNNASRVERTTAYYSYFAFSEAFPCGDHSKK